jgi:ribokinase
MRKTVFLGDFNVDLIMDGMEAEPQPDQEVGCSSFNLAIGASSCIAACAYACLGGDGWSCGMAGDDAFGRFMIEGLESCGVHTRLVRRDPGEKTGVTVNLVRGAGRYQVTYPGSMERLSVADIPDELFRDLRHLHVAGVYQAKTLLPGIGALLRRARSAGATTSLDCQWDPTQRWEHLREWLPDVDWLFANEVEALSMTALAGHGAVEALEALTEMCACPVVKRGPLGAILMADGRPLSVPGVKVPVIDTIGAGDNFDAGFLYAVTEGGMPLPQAARFAVAAAGRSCTFRGGTAARSTLKDIQRFMEKNG